MIPGGSQDRFAERPAFYRIRVQGHVDPRSSARWRGMALSSEGQPGDAAVTILAGELPDQGVLAAILNTLYDLGFALLSVECLPEAEGGAPLNNPI